MLLAVQMRVVVGGRATVMAISYVCCAVRIDGPGIEVIRESVSRVWGRRCSVKSIPVSTKLGSHRGGGGPNFICFRARVGSVFFYCADRDA